MNLSDSRKTWIKIAEFLFEPQIFYFFENLLTLSINNYINKYLTRQKFSVKDSKSKRSWLVYNPCLTAINVDNMSFSYQSTVSGQSKAVPPPPPGGSLLCSKLKNTKLLLSFLLFVVLFLKHSSHGRLRGKSNRSIWNRCIYIQFVFTFHWF